MARKIVRKDGESIAMFNARVIEARADAANRMREVRANKVREMGDTIAQTLRLVELSVETTLNSNGIVGTLTIGDTTLDLGTLYNIPKRENRLLWLADKLRTPKQSQIVCDLLAAQVLNARPISSRVPILVDKDVSRVIRSEMSKPRYRRPTRGGLTGRLAWDIVRQAPIAMHGSVVHVDNRRYENVDYMIRRVANDAPIVSDKSRYEYNVVPLSGIAIADGAYTPIAIAKYDNDERLSPNTKAREKIGAERYKITGSVYTRGRPDNFSAPRKGYIPCVEAIEYMRHAAQHDASDRRRAYACVDTVSRIAPIGWIAPSAPIVPRSPHPMYGAARPHLTVWIRAHGYGQRTMTA